MENKRILTKLQIRQWLLRMRRKHKRKCHDFKMEKECPIAPGKLIFGMVKIVIIVYYRIYAFLFGVVMVYTLKNYTKQLKMQKRSCIMSSDIIPFIYAGNTSAKPAVDSLGGL